MTALPPIRNAMIVIAVSKYRELPDLPGTITSANRIAEWARGDSPARNYRVHMITDEGWADKQGTWHEGKVVTTQRLKTEIRDFLKSDYIDRLVVYFAGHGMAGTTANDFWLLHDAKSDPGEGVNFLSFKTLLEYQNIGAFADPEVLKKGQLSIIVDACRTGEKFGIDFEGSAILRKEGPHKPLETDLYLATTRGEFAFQPNAVEGRSAYCLFSDALSDALEGRVPDVIQTDHHPYAPVVTSSRLANWLEEELPQRALQFDEHLEPDPRPGFRSYNDYYEIFGENTQETGDWRSVGRSDGGGGDKNGTISVGKNFEEISDLPPNGPAPQLTVGRRKKRPQKKGSKTGFGKKADLAIRYARALARSPVFIQGHPKIAVPEGTESDLRIFNEGIGYGWGFEFQGSQPIFVQNVLGDGWTMVPLLSADTSSVVLKESPGEVFIVGRHSTPRLDDLSLTRFATEFPYKFSDAMKLVDSIRYQKKIKPNSANRAGYLYQLTSDKLNAIRTAHYMADAGCLGFDLALVAAERIVWSVTECGYWRVTADLPPIAEENRPEVASPHHYRTVSEGRTGVELTQMFPIFRQGWDLLTLREFETLPPILRDIATHATGRNVTVLPHHAMKVLIQEFHYTVQSFGGVE